MDRDLESRIRERAYQLWEEEGQPKDREKHHWDQATAEFAEARQQPPASAPTSAKKGAKAPVTRRSARGAGASDAGKGNSTRAKKKRP